MLFRILLLKVIISIFEKSNLRKTKLIRYIIFKKPANSSISAKKTKRLISILNALKFLDNELFRQCLIF